LQLRMDRKSSKWEKFRAGKKEGKVSRPFTAKKEQVVETTCGSHEKTSRDNFKNPGKLPVRKFLFPGVW